VGVLIIFIATAVRFPIRRGNPSWRGALLGICSARVMGYLVYSIIKNVPPWSAGLATRSVVGFVAPKEQLFSEIAKFFEEKE